jgi:hypothetical protein
MSDVHADIFSDIFIFENLFSNNELIFFFDFDFLYFSVSHRMIHNQTTNVDRDT